MLISFLLHDGNELTLTITPPTRYKDHDEISEKMANSLGHRLSVKEILKEARQLGSPNWVVTV